MTNTRVRDLLAKLQLEAELLQNRYNDERGAFLHRKFANDLDAALRAQDDQTLTLTEAGKVSGYSADHLGRMIRDGKLPNAGRHNAPRVRRGDLPAKSSHLHEEAHLTHIAPHSRTQIARSIVNPH